MIDNFSYVIIYQSSFLSFLTFYMALRPFLNIILCFCGGDVTSET